MLRALLNGSKVGEPVGWRSRRDGTLLYLAPGPRRRRPRCPCCSRPSWSSCRRWRTAPWRASAAASWRRPDCVHRRAPVAARASRPPTCQTSPTARIQTPASRTWTARIVARHFVLRRHGSRVKHVTPSSYCPQNGVEGSKAEGYRRREEGGEGECERGREGRRGRWRGREREREGGKEGDGKGESERGR